LGAEGSAGGRGAGVGWGVAGGAAAQRGAGLPREEAAAGGAELAPASTLGESAGSVAPAPWLAEGTAAADVGAGADAAGVAGSPVPKAAPKPKAGAAAGAAAGAVGAAARVGALCEGSGWDGAKAKGEEAAAEGAAKLPREPRLGTGANGLAPKLASGEVAAVGRLAPKGLCVAGAAAGE
jgi:hypothetical protein